MCPKIISNPSPSARAFSSQTWETQGETDFNLSGGLVQLVVRQVRVWIRTLPPSSALSRERGADVGQRLPCASRQLDDLPSGRCEGATNGAQPDAGQDAHPGGAR